MKITGWIGCSLTAIACHAGAQIINGDFENEFEGWSHNAGVYIIGQPGSQPIGIGGTFSADLGGAEITGSELWQTVPVVPRAHYRLNFYSASNGDREAGKIAVGKVQIEAAGQLITSMTISNTSPGFMIGDLGFVAQKLNFKVPRNVDEITIRFLDQTPNGGFTIDWVIDKVSLTQRSRFGHSKELTIQADKNTKE